MDTTFRRRRAGTATALLAAAGLALAACSGPARSTAAAPTAAITPGSGQSGLTGMPGSTATGPAGQTSAAPSAAGSMPPMSMPTSTAAQAPGGAPVAGDSVAVKNFAFAPAALTVKVGTTVTWTNQDADAHTVTSQNGSGPLNSQALSTGQSFSYRFAAPGTYHYLCTIHPFMTATVTVTR